MSGHIRCFIVNSEFQNFEEESKQWRFIAAIYFHSIVSILVTVKLFEIFYW